MILAAFFLAAILAQIDNDHYSVETKKRYEAYARCFAKETYGRREASGSPEVHMREAKGACRNEYESFVAGAVKDSEGATATVSAAINARCLLDDMDSRMLIGPPPPAKLANLPVEGIIGDWRLGGGPLAFDLNVHFADDGSLVGIFEADDEPALVDLRSWRVTSNGTNEAVLHATFAGGRGAKYNRVPSFPSGMDFINVSEKTIQRIDLAIEDSELLIRLVTPDGGTQLRFHRQIDTARGCKRE